MILDSLYEKFKAAQNPDEICDCVLEALQFKENFPAEKSDRLNEILARDTMLIYQTLKMLGENNGARAKDLIYPFVKAMGESAKKFFVLYYLLGRANYQTGDYLRAAKFLGYYDIQRMERLGDIDELSFFYRANCLAKIGRFIDATEIYKAALEVKSDFPEAQKNLDLVRSGFSENLALEVQSLWNFGDYLDVPIFINSRDRIGVLKKLIDWLLDAGYRNLIILDNASTYPALLEYYAELEKISRVKIIKFEENLGYKALWTSGVLENLKIATPYIYTDPDILPVENCPKDFVRRLFEILDAHHEVRKVGLALVYDDITFFDKEIWQKHEAEFYRSGYIDGKISYANVDTTLALYSNLRSYSLRFSLRTHGDLMCRHLPWYFDYDNLPPDEKYYLEHADKNFVTTTKDKI